MAIKKPADKIRVSKKIDKNTGETILEGSISISTPFNGFDELRQKFIDSDFNLSPKQKKDVMDKIENFFDGNIITNKMTINLEQTSKDKS